MALDLTHISEFLTDRDTKLDPHREGPFSTPDEHNSVSQESLPAGIPQYEHLWYPDDRGVSADDKKFRKTEPQTKEIPTNSIVTPQDSVDPRRLNQLWSDPSSTDGGHPDVVHEPETGKNHLLDGNHRVTVNRHDNQMFTQANIYGVYDGESGPVQPQNDEYKANWAESGDPSSSGSFDWQPRGKSESNPNLSQQFTPPTKDPNQGKLF